MKYKTKLYLLFICFAMWTLVLCLAITYFKTRKIILDELRSKVLTIAATGASLIDESYLKQMNLSDEDGQSLTEILTTIRDTNRRADLHVVHLEILRPDLDDPDRFSIVIDVANELPSKPIYPGNLYPEGKQIGLQDHLQELYSPDHLIQDRWGTFLSAFAPIRDRQGNYVATLSTSLSAHYVTEQLYPLLLAILLAGGLALVISIAIAHFFASWLTRSLESITRAVERIRLGELQVRVVLNTRDEFGQLGQAINDMAQGLEERERIAAHFIRYVSKHILEKILSSDKMPSLKGERRKVTILFADIRGFTSFAEKLPPEEVVCILNEFFSKMLDVVFANQGTLDKFLGDGLMVEFGAPLDDPCQEKNAVKTAIEMQHALVDLCHSWELQGKPQIKIGIGIHTGQVIVGDIGSKQRINYTAIGDAVNVANLLQEATKTFHVPILISEDTQKALQGEYLVQKLGTADLPGRNAPVVVYSVALPPWLNQGA